MAKKTAMMSDERAMCFIKSGSRKSLVRQLFRLCSKGVIKVLIARRTPTFHASSIA